MRQMAQMVSGIVNLLFLIFHMTDADWLKKMVVEQDIESRYLIGHIPELPGVHSQAETMDELETNIIEVLHMYIEEVW